MITLIGNMMRSCDSFTYGNLSNFGIFSLKPDYKPMTLTLDLFRNIANQLGILRNPIIDTKIIKISEKLDEI